MWLLTKVITNANVTFDNERIEQVVNEFRRLGSSITDDSKAEV